MYGILVISPAGETISSVGLEKFSGDSSLLGGFVSAVQVFVDKISGRDMSELQFGDMKMLVHRVHDNFLVTLHSASDASAEERSRAVLSLVRELPEDNLGEEMSARVGRLLEGNGQESEKVRKSLMDWSKQKKAASEWSKTVF